MKGGWFVALSLAVGCAPAWAETGKAAIHGTAEGSKISGTATFSDTTEGLKVSIQLANVPPGKHGFHIHQFGSCGDQGKAAGGHYNPDGVQHGFLPKDGFATAHAGDFGNLEVAPDGTGTLAFTIPGLHVSADKHAVAGRAVILHENPDDFSQPTGNAGGRIGCGVIVINPD